MKLRSQKWQLAWFMAALVGMAAPALAMVLIVNAHARISSAPFPLAHFGGPILAVGLMGAGMIGAAAASRLGVGILLALLTGAGLVGLARVLGMPPLPNPVSLGLAVVIASTSFAARGALFARSASDKGWWIALLVIAGEVSIVLTALAAPEALPDWLLALLPAQWASVAIQTALTGPGALAAGSAMLALAGTAAATLLVAWLWPQRWPYLVMFTAWLALSALVLHQPGPPLPRADSAIVEPLHAGSLASMRSA
ncbi:hypothetical protein [Erythrobacter sp.]|jgi:hypothetical protein|uniref:hypothetical protein n=1 Tax=Erythrobacter sp. TaxID=1042 RepID=UPI002EB5D76F|nr:hypothetical protein [Erythrobacter sp.]